jgi:hypothetical protein
MIYQSSQKYVLYRKYIREYAWHISLKQNILRIVLSGGGLSVTKRSRRAVGKMPGSALVELVICFVAVTSILACVMRSAAVAVKISAALCRERTEIEGYSSMLREINAGVISSDADRGLWSVRVANGGGDGSPGPLRVTVTERGGLSRVQAELSLWRINSR